MVYQGWLQFNGHEVINNARAYWYAHRAGMGWIEPCGVCDTVPPDQLTEGPYLSTKDDPAPWYDENVGNSLAFYGVMGLEFSQFSDCVVQRTVTEYAANFDSTLVGAVSPASRTAKEMNVRALLLARDSASVHWGFDWLRAQLMPQDSCNGADLRFFNACPCSCESHGEVTEACLAECLYSERRKYTDTYLMEGPTVLSEPQMHSCGAIMEVEFTLVTVRPCVLADPWIGTLTASSVNNLVVDEVPPEPRRDPFGGWYVSDVEEYPLEPRVTNTQWYRTEYPLQSAPVTLDNQALVLTLTADSGQVDEIRVTVWHEGTSLADYYVPFIPADASVVLDLFNRKAVLELGSYRRSNTGFVTNGIGYGASWPLLPNGDLSVSVDVGSGVGGSVTVDAEVMPVGYQ